MGLDMYLHREFYIYDWGKKSAPEKTISVVSGESTFPKVDPAKVSGVREKVAYWRKFNALHGWFVDRCADGVDDCRQIYVSIEDFEELLQTLREAREILDKADVTVSEVPDWNGNMQKYIIYHCADELDGVFEPRIGFFFGSDEIDTYFSDELNRTIELVENILSEREEWEKGQENESKDIEYLDYSYYYQASW